MGQEDALALGGVHSDRSRPLALLAFSGAYRRIGFQIFGKKKTIRIPVLGHTGNTGTIQIRGGSFSGPITKAVHWEAGKLMLSMSSFYQWVSGASSAAAYISGGAGMLQGNIFHPTIGKAIQVTGGTGKIMITGNQLNGNTVPANGGMIFQQNNQ